MQSSVCAAGDQMIARIDEKRVAQLARDTSVSLLRRRKIRPVVLMASGVCELVRAGVLVKSLFDWFFPAPTKNDGLNKVNSIASNEGSHSEEQGWGAYLKGYAKWDTGGKSLGLLVVGFGANIFSRRLDDKMNREYFDAESLDWFVRERAPYKDVLIEMRLWVMGLNPMQVASPDVVVPFLSAYQGLIQHLERVLSYCTFKQKEFGWCQKPKKAQVVKLLIQRLTREVNEQGDIIAQAAVGTRFGVYRVSHALRALEATIEVCCSQNERNDTIAQAKVAVKWLDVRAISHALRALEATIEVCCSQMARLEGSRWNGLDRKYIASAYGLEHAANALVKLPA